MMRRLTDQILFRIKLWESKTDNIFDLYMYEPQTVCNITKDLIRVRYRNGEFDLIKLLRLFYLNFKDRYKDRVRWQLLQVAFV